MSIDPSTPVVDLRGHASAGEVLPVQPEPDVRGPDADSVEPGPASREFPEEPGPDQEGALDRDAGSQR